MEPYRGVGLGAKESCDYERFGESVDNKVLAEKLEDRQPGHFFKCSQNPVFSD